MLDRFFRRKSQSTAAAPPKSALPATRSELAIAQKLLEDKDIEGAAACCKRHLRSEPGDISGLRLIFRTALLLRTFAAAMECLTAGVQIHPESAELHFMLGYLQLQHGDIAASVASLEGSLKLDENSANVRNSLGSALQILGRLEEAQQQYRLALELDPDCWRASYNLGIMAKLHGRFEDAIAPFLRALQARRRLDAVTTDIDLDDPRVTYSKLTHDHEQLSYLAQRGLLHDDAQAALAAYGETLNSPAFEMGTQLSQLPAPIKSTLGPYYNRLTNFYNAPALSDGAINQDQDWPAIARNYFGNGPGMTYFDRFLKPEALESLRRFCLESTIWFDFLYGAGYVGCTCEDGFICPLLAQIAEETKSALHAVIGSHKLNGMWGYKYDSEASGISVHADFAAVNVNFWLTPDAANLAPGRGGLVVWDKEAPIEWDFEDYNSKPDSIAEFLRQSAAKEYIVPHRQNRVVLFNSNLFHRTDDYYFQPGYENRRINVTMLYGDRQEGNKT